MFGLDDSSSIGISVAIGVAVIFAVVFILGLLCALLGLVIDPSAGHEAMVWLV
jgi:hypothetical protein